MFLHHIEEASDIIKYPSPLTILKLWWLLNLPLFLVIQLLIENTYMAASKIWQFNILEIILQYNWFPWDSVYSWAFNLSFKKHGHGKESTNSIGWKRYQMSRILKKVCRVTGLPWMLSPPIYLPHILREGKPATSRFSGHFMSVWRQRWLWNMFTLEDSYL